MKVSNAESLAKIELLIEFLQQKKEFNGIDLATQLAMSRTLPYILMRAGFIKRVAKNNFMPTDLVDSLTTDVYRKIASHYYSENKAKRVEKKKVKKELSITEFLKNKISAKDNAKELAVQIYNLIKPHL